MKKIHLLLSLLLFNHTFSFDKRFSDFVVEYDQSDFIAKIKILKFELSKTDSRYFDVSFEIIDLYKGKKKTSFKIYRTPYDFCNLDFTKNSTWLLFASFDHNNVLNTEHCAGSIEIDKKLNSAKYPNIEETYRKKVESKIEILNFLKKEKIKKINAYGLKISYKNSCNIDFNGYEVLTQKFAVYKLKVDKDLSINCISAIKEFDNNVLSKKMLDCYKNVLEIDNSEIKSIKTKTDFYLIYYYYPAEGEKKSFISTEIL